MQNMKALYCVRCYDGDMRTLTRIGDRWLCEYCLPDATPHYEPDEELYTVEEEYEDDQPPAVVIPESPVLLIDELHMTANLPPHQETPPPQSESKKKRRPSMDAEQILGNMKRTREDDVPGVDSEPTRPMPIWDVDSIDSDDDEDAPSPEL